MTITEFYRDRNIDAQTIRKYLERKKDFFLNKIINHPINRVVYYLSI